MPARSSSHPAGRNLTLDVVALWAVLVGTEDAGAAPSPGVVVATRDRLAPNAASPVSHDNEVMALASDGRALFAATDQWEYEGPHAAGQILVEDGARAPSSTPAALHLSGTV